jgi:hypothetical protein
LVSSSSSAKRSALRRSKMFKFTAGTSPRS